MKNEHLLIQPYQESWANDFLKIKEVLIRQLHDISVTFEHVGSTSVPGLSAKPIIDIDLIHKPNDFSKIDNGLTQLGYFHNGDQGIAEREAFKREVSSKTHPILDWIKHHLYVCPDFSKELKRHLLFRDYLKGDEVTRKVYESLKLQIAEKADQDRKTYAKLKEVRATEFIESVLIEALKLEI